MQKVLPQTFRKGENDSEKFDPLDIYTHVTGEMRKDAAQRMGSFMAQTV